MSERRKIWLVVQVGISSNDWVARAHLSQQRAAEDLTLLSRVSTDEWRIDEVELVE